MEPMPFYQDEQIPLKLSPNTETLQPVSKQARNPKAISVFRLKSSGINNILLKPHCIR